MARETVKRVCTSLYKERCYEDCRTGRSLVFVFAQEVHDYSVEGFFGGLWLYTAKCTCHSADLAITRYSVFNDVTMQRIGVVKLFQL